MRRLRTAVRALLLWVLPALITWFTCVPAVSGPPPPAPGPAPAGDRAWPVAGARGARPLVVRAWEPPPAPWAAGHRGVDLDARAGAPVRAAAPGRVSFAGTVAGRGVVSVELAGTGSPALRTTYEPVRATVSEGAAVAAGEVVGVLQAGLSHCAAGCLHWGLRRGAAYLDPLSLLPPWMLRRPPSRLLPLTGALGAPGGVSRALLSGPWSRPLP
ncbi:M23 family metallopeptidase [Streptomyces sp. NPDC026206]|uniref:murein hydrolase activator EnvC family protein n=1 Tax=Streptomyces sp. NPDC026206 TaxID=3157089 RepID=UPI0033DE1C1D